jgi:transposase-like protein
METFSTRVPLRFRFTADRCPACGLRHNLPRDIIDSTPMLAYKCRRCHYQWKTSWSPSVASAHSTLTLTQLLDAGLSSVEEAK